MTGRVVPHRTPVSPPNHGVHRMELESEETWLRKRIVRLRTVLRYALDPRTEAGLREFIGDAEHRLELLQNRRPVVQQQQQVQPKRGRSRKVAGKLTALA